MADKELQVRTLFQKMLEDAEEYKKTYEYYAEDMKDFNAKVQWRFGPIKGYQVFKGTEYSYGMDGEVENPDIVIECDDLNFVKQFLKNELDDMRDLAKADFEITSPNIADSAGTNAFRQLRASISRIPAFRPLMEKNQGTQSTAVAIPINESLGTYENQILPLAVIEHFINKASHIFLYELCPCRVTRDCQNFDHYAFGCMCLGRGVLRMKPNDGHIIQGHLATKEEALDMARRAVEVGLQPGFGRLRGDAVNRIGGPIPDTGDLFNLCYCCPCCCVVGSKEHGGIKDSPRYMREMFQRMEGVTVTVDSELCTGCEECLDVCVFGGMEFVDGKAVVNEMNCFGCGRCERACPAGAISITMEEDSVERMIARIEAHVDVT
ncbi:MAG: ferredoxin family protein [Dehalococcoidales bacterium]|nr:ferredoxin family protein [Dehalococcoidales bacterium]